jgi:hypothetical protein
VSAGALTIVPTDELGSFARIANEQHAAVKRKAREGLEHARTAREVLIRAKAAVEYGHFGKWIDKHCEFSHVTACQYMRLAMEWDTVCTFRGALNLTRVLDILRARRREETCGEGARRRSANG